jgi:hypothetical protein
MLTTTVTLTLLSLLLFSLIACSGTVSLIVSLRMSVNLLFATSLRLQLTLDLLSAI